MLDPKVQLPDCITKLFRQAIWRFEENKKIVYLTFDDGPVPEITTWVLDLLKEEGIKATFFCVGENVKRYSNIYSRILDEGHAVGNHTYNHLQGLMSFNKTYYSNISKAEKYIDSDLFRPPHGWMRPMQYKVISKRFKIIMWDVISNDYNSDLSSKKVIQNITDYVRPGSIITFHDSIKAAKNLKSALPLCILWLKEQGYEFKAIPYNKPSQTTKSELVSEYAQ